MVIREKQKRNLRKSDLGQRTEWLQQHFNYYQAAGAASLWCQVEIDGNDWVCSQTVWILTQCLTISSGNHMTTGCFFLDHWEFEILTSHPECAALDSDYFELRQLENGKGRDSVCMCAYVHMCECVCVCVHACV